MQDLTSNEEATEASALKEKDNDTEAKGIKKLISKIYQEKNNQQDNII